MSDTAFFLTNAAALALLVSGSLGALIPALPGLPVMIAGVWLLGYAGGFSTFPVWGLVLLTLVLAGGIAADYAASLFGAKRAGASKTGVAFGVAGSIAGMFFGLWGALFGAAAGSAVGELAARRGILAAGKAGAGSLAGLLLGTAVKTACVLAVWVSLLLMWLFR